MPVHSIKSELERLSNNVKESIANSKAQNTLIAYWSDWIDFTLWCEELHLQYLPATPEVVTMYMAHLTERNLKGSTIQRRLAAISRIHKSQGYESPTNTLTVREAWHGMVRQRKITVAQKGKDALLTEHIRLMVNALLPYGLMGLRDRALLLLGFTGAFRRSELVSLNVEDVLEEKEGLTVHLQFSKTDQEGQGRDVAILYGTHYETCPVRTLREWMQTAHITTGPLFRRFRFDHLESERLSPQGVARVVKRAARLAGLDPTNYSGHSLRVGFVTSALQGGASEMVVMDQTGHKTPTMVRRYRRKVNKYKESPTQFLGL